MSSWGCAVIHFSLVGVLRGGACLLYLSLCWSLGAAGRRVWTVFLRQICYPVLGEAPTGIHAHAPGPSLPEVPVNLRGSRRDPQGLGPDPPSSSEVGKLRGACVGRGVTAPPPCRPPCRASSRMAPSTSTCTSPRVASTRTPGRRPCTAGSPQSTCLGVSQSPQPRPAVQEASGLGASSQCRASNPRSTRTSRNLVPRGLGLAGALCALRTPLGKMGEQ